MATKDSFSLSAFSLSNSARDTSQIKSAKIFRKRLDALKAGLQLSPPLDNHSWCKSFKETTPILTSTPRPKRARRLFDSFDADDDDDTADNWANLSIEGADASSSISVISNSTNNSRRHFTEHYRLVEKRRTITDDSSNGVVTMARIFHSIDKKISMFLFFAFCSLIIFASIIINQTQPVPFIDEIFHIRQARQYCRGNFHHVSTNLCFLASVVYLC